MPSRRELMALMLGAPLAAEACSRGFGSRRFAGELRGADHKLGHRLRDATVERTSGPPERTRVAIVGAGPSGLSAAWCLERAGFQDYVLLDLEGRAGGTSSYGTDGVVPYPWGAHYVPLPGPDNPALSVLLTEMGVLENTSPPEAREQLMVRAPEERLFIDGSWIPGVFPMPGAETRDLQQLEQFQREIDRWIAFRDALGRRAFTIPMARASDAAEVTALDRQSASQWLDQRGLTSTRLRWWIEYACRDDYGLTLKQTSAWAMLFYFCARIPAPGAASAPFVAWPEGNGAIVRHLSARVGPRLRTNQLVTDVVPSADGVALSVYDEGARTLRRLNADRVILALPKFVASKIFRPWRESPQWLEEFQYGAWIVANVHLSRRPRSRGFEQAWENVIYDSPSVGYVVATHQRLMDRGPTIFSYYQPLLDDDPKDARKRLLALDQQTIASAAVADLARAHDGFEGAVSRVDAWRWGHAMVQPRPGFVWGAARRRAARPAGRVHFAHSDLSGLALFEEAQDHGVRAAEEILRAEGREIRSLRGG